jgi:predicted phage terminase large subunit-like protein
METLDDPRTEILRLEYQLEKLEILERARTNFLDFVRYVWPQFICGPHHKAMAQKFEALVRGDLTRVIINIAPRHGKSELTSYFFLAWLMGRAPNSKIIQATHTGELAQRFGRKVRNLMDSEEYREVFPEVLLASDSKAAGRWETNKGGEYFAAGVGGAITGRGADFLVIDDPHSEQDALSETAMGKAYEWYTSGPRQRLQPGGRILLVMTRWSKVDLTGMVLADQAKDPRADKWEVIEFPAIMPSGNPCWPEFWKIKDLLSIKAALPVAKWNAQWMQDPTAEEGAIFKREWWKVWQRESVPRLHYVIQSYDTAYSKKETADYSAITTWGVFKPSDDSEAALILLGAYRARLDFPELKRQALEQYRYWNPDVVLIEAKAAGLSLTQELRRTGIPVINYSPGGRNKAQDKVARAHAVSPVFEAGMVWAPDEDWAVEVVEEMAEFPYGDHDDYVDTAVQAVMRFRQGNFLTIPSDWVDEEVGPPKFSYYDGV